MRCLALLLVAGCMHDLPVRAPEQCATQGMVLEGETTKIGEDDPELHCRRVRSPVDACELQAAQKSLAARLDYSTGGRNWLIFVGYAAFIGPGVLLSIVFGRQRDRILAAADQSYIDELATCSAPVEVSGPPGG